VGAWEIRTEQFVVIVTVALALVVMALVFASVGGSGNRIICNAWKIRPDGAFEAETNAGTIRFRRKDIQFIEPYPGESNTHTWVCLGNLQRMIWIDFPDEAQALQFISLMERKFFTRNLNGMQDPF
jgi:hypothetical protein